jgi:hypothetical protein
MQVAPENVINAQNLQLGYKETWERFGISESKEVELSLVHRRDLWEEPHVSGLRQVAA